jgi:hypothetical protein
MEGFKNAVANAIQLYSETSGMSIQEVGKRFRDSNECREAVYLLVAMQANNGPYAQRVLA